MSESMKRIGPFVSERVEKELKDAGFKSASNAAANVLPRLVDWCDLHMVKLMTDELYMGPIGGVDYAVRVANKFYLHGMREIRDRREFSGNELTLIIEAFNSTIFNADIVGQQLRIGISESMKYEYLDKKWDVDAEKLLYKISRLSTEACMALEVWSKGFWTQSIRAGGIGIEEYVAQLSSNPDDPIEQAPGDQVVAAIEGSMKRSGG